jgi:hydrogenase maturation protein HypF
MLSDLDLSARLSAERRMMSLPDFSAVCSTPVTGERVRLRVEVRGAVQGVGFRPFVYRLASELGLAGWVNNSSQGAVIEVEGKVDSLAEFLRRLRADKPLPCVLHDLTPVFLPTLGYTDFAVRDSSAGGAKTAVILPDLATCADCLHEIFDPGDRRFRYPFTNCTNCGPRYSIVEGLPYDRPRTTMKRFLMCDACRAEYDNPADRRFHAQPNACPRCGPHLELWDAAGNVRATREEALRATTDALRRGDIVAAKGLGGFHLLVDASNQEAVLRLRRRKLREEKPFGLMYPGLEAVQRDCRVSSEEERLLCSPEAPLVLLRRRPGDGIAPAVAPGNPYLGVMLPYTPLHHLLLAKVAFPIVATSGNRSDEPICTDQHEALTRLGGIADVFLIHNRPIARPVDDSVVRIVLGQEMVLRRARGYAPYPVPFGESPRPLLAVGGHQKNTIAAAVGCQVVVSQHVGDLDTPLAFESFRRAIADLSHLYELEPEAVACDAHPDYLSTHHAEKMGLPIVRVQHHYAHIRACMAEHGLSEPLLGVAWDGTGFGPDGTVWGGEFLRITDGGFERVAHFRTFRLPGGEGAARQPRRSALGLLHELLGEDAFANEDLAPLRTFSPRERGLLRTMLRGGLNAPRTSSAGRLFDAVAALLGIRQVASFEGQAAMELEFAVEGAAAAGAYPFHIDESGIIDWGPMIRAILRDIALGPSTGTIARRFHDTLAEIIVAAARLSGESVVALTGGCFQNSYLLEQAVTRLREGGFRVHWPQRIPPNDGGIALGQIVAAASSWRRTE